MPIAQILSGEPTFGQLIASRGEALLAEARLQNIMGMLSAKALDMVETVVANPVTAQRTDDRIQVASLELSGATKTELLPGVLVIARTDAFTASHSAQSVVLFWPGRTGGLAEFTSWQALQDVLAPEGGSAKDRVVTRPIGTHIFECSVLDQLAYYDRRATAICAGERRFDDAPGLQASLQRLHAETLSDLTVPFHAARDQLLTAHFEREKVMRRVHVQPGWLQGLSQEDGAEGKHLVRQMCDAMHDSHELLASDLPPRGEFVEDLLRQRLQADFAVSEPVRVILDLPESVKSVKELIADSGAPGTPFREVLRPSEQRVNLPLAEVALMGIDDAFKARLNFLRVQVVVDDADEARRLESRIDADYLIALVEGLDVAEQFEQRIRAVHGRLEAESDFAMQFRRERLCAPYLAQLRLQTWVARMRKVIDVDGEQIINAALLPRQADAPEDELDVVLRSIILNAPGSELNTTGVALAGVVLMENRTSGKTVMYLPDVPNWKVLTEHDSAQQACQSLIQMSLEPGMADYLSARPVSGDPAAHASYIRQAQLKHFDGFIRVDSGSWPRNIPLPEHLVNVQMGRLIEAHRSTSRSQTDLYFELAAQSTSVGTIFGYISMALGIVPFVGTGLALVDALRAAVYSADAFVEGKVGEGLDHIEAVLLSLIDAAMDSLPGGSVAATGAARRAARLGRFSAGFKAAIRHSGKSRHAPFSRFDGYESSTPWWKLPARQLEATSAVHTLDGQKYIVRDAKVYAVEWDADYSTWRLRGNDVKSYKQPIALDRMGRWDTQGAVDGALVRGGLKGGGAHLTRMASDGWVGISGYLRRRLRGIETEAQKIDRLCWELQTHFAGLDDLKRRLNHSQELIRQGDLGSTTQLIHEQAVTDYRNFFVIATEKILAIGPHGPGSRLGYKNALNDYVHRVMRAARALEDRYVNDFLVFYRRMQEVGDFDPGSEVVDLSAVTALMQLHMDFLYTLRKASDHRAFQENWYERVNKVGLTESTRKALKDVLDTSTSALGYKIAQMGSILIGAVMKVPIAELARTGFKGKVEHALVSYAELMSGGLDISNKQRIRMLTKVVSQFRDIELAALGIEASSARLLDQSFWPVLHKSLMGFKLDAETRLANLENQLEVTVQRTAGKQKGQSTKKVFETVDDELLIGVARTTAKGERVMDVLEPVSGRINETYHQEGKRWALVKPVSRHTPPSAIKVEDVLAEAEEAMSPLESLLVKVKEYAKTSMEPASLEDILELRASQLDTLGNKLVEVPEQPAIVAMRDRLKAQSQQLRAEGVRLRVEACKRLPTQGHLDYLLGRREVSIKKVVDERVAQLTPKGRVDGYLQEYMVHGHDGRPLWYAHFHYAKVETPFVNFSKAHLKTPDQRYLGLKSQMAEAHSGENITPILRAPISQAIAVKHFQSID
ncbi:dermonecrotic toxin domain-containing protein [Pseudomonas sp.]|uniref:dermonecrotic toxin domain-containing protein n=1 Tax=Pseudomonas sp. TaxID=306 RepID=UPI002ED88CE6